MESNKENNDLDVLICDKNNNAIGSGILAVTTETNNVAYILTAAHLFVNTGNAKEFINRGEDEYEIDLNIYSAYYRKWCLNRDEKKAQKAKRLGKLGIADIPVYRFKEVAEEQSLLENPFIVIHDSYDPEDPCSTFDAAVVYIQSTDWMEKINSIQFGKSSAQRIPLLGYGYPVGDKGLCLKSSDDFAKYVTSFRGVTNGVIYEDGEFQVEHDYNRRDISLNGISGTGLFDENGFFWGVIARYFGNSESPDRVWCTSAEVFAPLVGLFGWKPDIDGKQNTMESHVNLIRSAYWLQSALPGNAKGIMSDRMKINAASLLIGLSSPCVLIMATNANHGIAAAINRILEEQFQARREEPKVPNAERWSEIEDWHTEVFKGRQIINISARKTDLITIIKDILDKHNQRESSLILNIWSEKPWEAVFMVSQMKEISDISSKADFISLLGYSEILNYEENLSCDGLNARLAVEKTMSLSDEKQTLIFEKNNNIDWWWKNIPEYAKKGNAVEAFNGYLVAENTADAVWRWFEALPNEMANIIFCEDFIYNDMELNQSEIDHLALNAWLYLKSLNETDNNRRKVFQSIYKYCSKKITSLIEVLENQRSLGEMLEDFSGEEIYFWADNISPEQLDDHIEELKINEIFYWIAITRNPGGIKYIVEEKYFQDRSRFSSNLFNKVPKQSKDDRIEAKVRLLRRYIRGE